MLLIQGCQTEDTDLEVSSSGWVEILWSRFSVDTLLSAPLKIYGNLSRPWCLMHSWVRKTGLAAHPNLQWTVWNHTCLCCKSCFPKVLQTCHFLWLRKSSLFTGACIISILYTQCHKFTLASQKSKLPTLMAQKTRYSKTSMDTALFCNYSFP